jgi:glycosyltransferase involved in cell wall biosynthesis
MSQRSADRHRGVAVAPTARLRVLQVHTPHREFGGEDVAVEADRLLLESSGHTVEQILVENPRQAVATIGAVLRAPWNRSASTRVVDAALASRPDIVHVHNTWFALSPAVVRAVSAAGFPVVMTLHNFRSSCANGLLQRNGEPCTLCVGGHAGHAVLHRCYRHSAALSTSAALTIEVARRRRVWDDVARYLVLDESAVPELVLGGIPADRITVRPSFVPPAAPRATPPSSSTDVLYVGRLSPEKGGDVLLRAWRMAAPSRLQLRVYGDGALRAELERWAVPGVSFLGRVPPAGVATALGQARALVFPSTCREAGPLAPLEAAAAGVPIVLSDLVGMATRVVAAGAGWASPSGDPAALAAALARLDDDEAVDRAGGAALAMHAEHYAPGPALVALERAYRQAHDRQVTPR